MAEPTTSERSPRGAAGLVLAVAVAAALIVWALATGGPTLLVQRLVDGATNGVLYGVVAVALVLVFKATKVINFAQGSMAMLGAYLALTLIEAAVPVVLAVLAAMAVSALAAAGVERVLIRPFDPADHLPIVIVTLALFLGLNAAVALFWGFSPKTFPSMFPLGQDAYLDLLGARLDYADIGTLLVALAVIVVIEVVLRRSRLGLAFRAVATSVESARLLGIPVGRTVQFSWALAAAAGTLAACLIAPTTFLDPIFMNKILIYAFAAATLGGLDSLGGALAGGVLVGVVISLLEYVPALGGEFGLGAAFVIIVVVLQVRPAGLWGRRTVERV
jgi:branched-chain amino acid transport system permease protein